MENRTLKLENIRQIDHLYKFACFWGIVPPFDFNKKSPLCASKWYTISLLFTCIGLWSATIYGRIYLVFPHVSSTTLIVLDLIEDICFFTYNIFTFLLRLYLCDKFHKFVKNFIEIDKIFRIKVTEDGRRFHFYKKVLWVHLFLIVFVTYDGYVFCLALGLSVYLQYILRYIQIYQQIVTVLLMDNFINSLKRRFETINKILTKIDVPSKNYMDFHVIYKSSQSIDSYATLRYLSKIYKLLVNQISLFNKIFGLHILLLHLCIIVGLLDGFSATLVFGVYSNDSEQKYHIIIDAVFWIIFFVTLGAIISFSCHRAYEEAKKTRNICYSLLLKIPLRCFRNEEQLLLKKELRLLGTLSSQSCPPFSAAGFFPVNYSTMLTAFGVATSYIIVVLQFKN